MPHADFLAGGVGANVLVVDYRGFGNSQGVPTEKGVYTDADAALDYILQCQKVNNKDVFLFGHSLGGAVAIDLASRRGDEISGVVVENTFTSLRGALHDVLPFTKGVTWILNMIQRIKLASIDKVRSLKVPILFTSGTDDELIPSSHSEKLYEECGAKTKWRIEVRRGTHNNTYGVGGEKYAAFIREFMETATKATAKAKALAAAAAKEEQQHDLEDAGISTKALAGSALAESSSSSSSRTSTAEAPEADTKAESGGAQTETAAATAGTDAAAAGIKAAATGAAPATAAEAPQVESLLLAGLISGLLLVLLSRQMQKQRSSNSSSSSRASQSASTNAIYDDSQWEEQSSSRYTSKGTEEAQVLLEPAISETSLY
ncbi:Hydrolase of the alpha/beta superfamily, related [Eimeria tenella]|uniref:Hydrolase of the alpha/beta superfamily, related n=1 Tax=Eimeria tenella TaxID=5802 RepID=H9B9S5_EIMTE|nr:Hydrolase of the alpha/beta superfamily, related [Eimeria tenella]AET50735.1 hypothetical protein [Eimeria tenella]CDJ41630.1 Hydrolase of the alpha/beta superfamily, related [Eimeria tenella]|eukprot:XP_013232380.1 Hydrolase of the alpha/beta superfamily, related [Eimeria tenella]